MASARLQGTLVVVLMLLNVAIARADNLADAIKATYLTKFAPFVDWPAEALPPDAPFVICAQGDDAVTPLIERAAGGQTLLSRPVAVRRMPLVQPTSGCHIAYLAGSEQQSLAAAVAALRGAPVLTVADGEKSGAIVAFVLENNRVRFDIDEQAAAAGGLTVSSKLLTLARRVNRR